MALVGPARALLGWEHGAPPSEVLQCGSTPPTACGAACTGDCLCIVPHSVPCFISRECVNESRSRVRDQGIPDNEGEFLFFVPQSR